MSHLTFIGGVDSRFRMRMLTFAAPAGCERLNGRLTFA
jgi:hypothetical protein